jgi:hypothetical protein
MSRTTCQICGRAIKAGNGLIAHHGYQRPGHGWQTNSCFGARYRPYEVACDALPPAIVGLGAYIARQQTTLASLLESPPATLAYERRGGSRYTLERSIKAATADMAGLKQRLADWKAPTFESPPPAATPFPEHDGGFGEPPRRPMASQPLRRGGTIHLEGEDGK